MRNRQKGLSQETAAAKAAISVRSGRKIEKGAHSSTSKPRQWRTRSDPLSAVWDSELVPLLEREPSLTGLTLLEHLDDHHPGDYQSGLLRTPAAARQTVASATRPHPGRDLPSTSRVRTDGLIRLHASG